MVSVSADDNPFRDCLSVVTDQIETEGFVADGRRSKALIHIPAGDVYVQIDQEIQPPETVDWCELASTSVEIADDITCGGSVTIESSAKTTHELLTATGTFETDVVSITVDVSINSSDVLTV